ncbi:MAG: hypothetical protein Q8L88_16215 [Bacteroidota bacterium]|nr:hypothetical protein [Bacteroidota bacterium]
MNYFLFSLFFFLFIKTASAQFIERIHFFPETTYVSPFAADGHAHRVNVENILFTKNVRTTMGGMFPLVNIDLFGAKTQAAISGSIHFELNPYGQVHVISNDYYVDFVTLDVPVSEQYFARGVAGHTSHHLSDNWYEQMKLTAAVRYSRDYLKLFLIRESGMNDQLYIGADFAYIFTVNGQRTNKRWTFQTGGKITLAELYSGFILYAAADCKIRQEAEFAATNSIQCGIATRMQKGKILRVSYQLRTGLDERGQFYPHHRMINTIGFAIEL